MQHQHNNLAIETYESSSDEDKKNRLQIEEPTNSVFDSIWNKHQKKDAKISNKLLKIKKKLLDQISRVRRGDMTSIQKPNFLDLKIIKPKNTDYSTCKKGFWNQVIKNSQIRYYSEDYAILNHCSDIQLDTAFDEQGSVKHRELRMFFKPAHGDSDNFEESIKIHTKIKKEIKFLFVRINYSYPEKSTDILAPNNGKKYVKLKVKTSGLPIEFMQKLYSSKDYKATLVETESYFDPSKSKIRESFFDIFLDRKKSSMTFSMSGVGGKVVDFVNLKLVEKMEIEMILIKLQQVVNKSFLWFLVK